MVNFFIVIVSDLVHIVNKRNAEKENVEKHLGSDQRPHSNILQTDNSSNCALINDTRVHFCSVVYDRWNQKLVHVIYLFEVIRYQVQIICAVRFARFSPKKFVYLHLSYHWGKVYEWIMDLDKFICTIFLFFFNISIIFFQLFNFLFAIYLFTYKFLRKKRLIIVNKNNFRFTRAKVREILTLY